MFCPEGRVFVHNDCPGGGFLLPSSRVPGGMVLDEIDTCISLGGKFDFFSPLRFEIQSDFDQRTTKIKFYSARALKYYLNEKYLIYGRV